MGLYDGRDILSLIRRLIHDETLYLRHWIGKVVDNKDELNLGRVKATVPEMGFLADADAIWCSPRQGYAIDPPAKDEWVEIYFIGGDSRRPVYLTGVGEIAGNTPAQYTDPEKKVLWQNPLTGAYVQYDEDAEEMSLALDKGELALTLDKLTIGGGAESFVLGDTFESYLSSLKTWMDTHTHATAATGPPVAPVPVSPSIPTIKSTVIKGE